MKRGLLTPVCFLAIAATGCWGESPDTAVYRWLTCIECVDGELADVVAAANQRGGVAVRLLESALREGPTEAQRSNMRHQVVGDWFTIPSDARAGLSVQDWLSTFMQSYEENHRHRAAAGLAATIRRRGRGSQAARAVFSQAIDDTTLNAVTRTMMLRAVRATE